MKAKRTRKPKCIHPAEWLRVDAMSATSESVHVIVTCESCGQTLRLIPAYWFRVHGPKV